MIPDFGGIKALIVGDVMLDCYVDGVASRISPEAPVPVLHFERERSIVGGAGNVAANVASLGGEPHLISVVGDDDDGSVLKRTLEGLGIAANLVVDGTRVTTRKTRFHSAGHQFLRLDRESIEPIGAETEQLVCDAFDETLPLMQVVVVSDYAKGVLTDAVLAHLLKSSRTIGVPVLVDPKRRDFGAYSGATLIKPNLLELKDATNLSCADEFSIGEAARKVIGLTGAAVLVTRSKKGMSLYRHGQAPVDVPTDAVEVFDVSGAGDTAMASVALAMAAGVPLPRAVGIANVAARIAVSKYGTVAVDKHDLHLALMLRERDSSMNKGELIGLPLAIQLRNSWRRAGLTVGFTNGCFDLVHPGHIALLRECKTHCDKLIVALNSDNSVERIKGPGRPIQDEVSRAAVIGAVDGADVVIIFQDDTPLSLIEQLKPDILIKGADYVENQVVGANLVTASGGKVVLVSITKGQSTSELLRRTFTPAGKKVPPLEG